MAVYKNKKNLFRILISRQRLGIMMENATKSSSVYESLTKGFELESAGDYDGAISSFKVAAMLGSTDAQSMLGTILDNRVVPPNPREAVYWYKKAVRAGDATCAWNLAMHYKDLKIWRWYVHWLQVADRMGDADATEELSSHQWWHKRHSSR